MVEADEKLLNDAMKSSEKVSMLAADVKITNRLKDYESLLLDIRKEIKTPKITFQRQKELVELQTKVTDLGTLIGDAPEALSFTNMKITSSNQVDTRMPSDILIPDITGLAFLPDGQAILCDNDKLNIKILSSAFTVKEVLQLQSPPCDVSVLSHIDAVITLLGTKQLQFLQTVPKLKTGRMIQLDKQCWAVEVAGEEIYVTCHEDWENGEVRVLDMAGNWKRTLDINKYGQSSFAAPQYLALSADATEIYVSDVGTNEVRSFKADGSAINSKYMNLPRCLVGGLCVDGEGNIVICKHDSREVSIVTVYGSLDKTLLSSEDGITSATRVAYRDGTLMVGCGNILCVLKLETFVKR